MAQTIRKTPNYLAIGIFMAIGILAILVSVIFADKLVTRFRGGYPLHIKFDNLDGLVIGSKVIVGSGKSIGQVESIDLDGSQLIVTIFINKNYKINNTATFEIFATSFVGGKYLAVENFTGQAPFFKPNDTIIGVTPVSINSIMTMFNDSISSGTDEGFALGITGIINTVNEIVSTANGILNDNRGNINAALTNLAVTSRHLKSISANLDRKLSSVNDREFRQMLNNTKSSLSNLEQFLSDINSDNAALSILKDPKITHSIRTIVTNLEETTERVKAKPSLLLRS